MPFINALPLTIRRASTARPDDRSKPARPVRFENRDRRLTVRRSLAGALLLLAACDRGGGEEEAGQTIAAKSAAVPQVSPADAQRMLQEKAAAGLRAILPNPDDARYMDVRAGAEGSVCGRIDTEQPDGKRSGFRPFLVTPEGVGVISLTPRVMLNDPEDIFPDYYIRWCATPAELATLEVAPDVNAAAPVMDVPADLPELAELPPQTEEVPATATPEVAAAAPPPPPSAPSKPGELESFSRAVIRNPLPAKESR